MASSIIHNTSVEPCALPYPFTGILKGGQQIKLNIAVATVIAALGGSTALGGLTVAEAPDGGPYNSEYAGSVGGGTTALAGPLTVTGTMTASGDVAAAGGFRRTIGPFTAPGAAGVTAASQTNLDLLYSHITGVVLSFVAPRAGSIMALSAAIDAAVTGAGTAITVKATVNGTEVGAALDLSLTQAGAEVKASATAAKDAIPFAAGDVIGISYTSTAITNTPKLVASIEVEC